MTIHRADRTSSFEIHLLVHQFSRDGPDMRHRPSIKSRDLFKFGHCGGEGLDVVLLGGVDEAFEKQILPTAPERGMLIFVAVNGGASGDDVDAQMQQSAFEENVFGAPSKKMVIGPI